jgi:hypothetical protein
MESGEGTRIVAALEASWNAIRKRHPEVPDVVVITGSGRRGGNRKGLTWGHHCADRWHDAVAAGRRAELFIAGEAIAVGGQMVLETQLHEAAHALAAVRGVKDTSSAGRWHNRKFGALAEELGLQRPAKAAPTIGFSECLITPATVAAYAPAIRRLEAAALLRIEAPSKDGQQDEEGQGDGKKGGRAGRRLAVECSCEPPRRLQITPKLLEGGPILCGTCRQEFHPDADEADEPAEPAV